MIVLGPSCNKDPVTPNYWVSANSADLGDTFAGDWERFSRVCRVIPFFLSKIKKYLSQIFEIRPGGASSGGHPNRQLVG